MIERFASATATILAPRFRFHFQCLGTLLILAALLLTPTLASAEEGYATWYGEPFHGRNMANGQIYNMYDPTTTASNIYPLGTWVKITNPANGKAVTVQVRDRGGFTHEFDLSYAAFKAIDDPGKMGIHVRYEVVSGPNGTPVTTAPTKTAPAPQTSTQTTTTPPSQYTVVAGDSLSSIATRFGLDATDLTIWNNINDPDALAIGQVLILHTPVAIASTPTARGRNTTYVVVEGDTLWSIALKFDTTPEELAAINGLTEDNILGIGDELQLSGSAVASISTAPTRENPGIYVVQEGNTMLGIALAHDTTVEAIMELNDLTEADFLQIGQELALP